MNYSENFIAAEELPKSAALKIVKVKDPDYGYSEDEIQDRYEFIRCYLLKDYELLLTIPKQYPGTDFFIHDCDVFEHQYSSFNTYDFQSRMRPFNKYAYAMKMILERVKDLAILHSCCSCSEDRASVQCRFEAYLDYHFRGKLICLIEQYKRTMQSDRRQWIKQKIGELNRRILDCKRIWERYAPPESWDS